MTHRPPASRASDERAARAHRLSELMAGVVGGDRASFEELYDATSPAVHGTALRVLRDPDLAAEVTQEVMIEVWRSADRFDPALGSVGAWVATMAHRRAVDRVRSVQSQRDRDELAVVGDYHRPHDEVVEAVERRLETEQVLECLGTLTALQREAVTSAYYGARTYREVARASGVALPTVKSRIRDGLDRLRRCLGVDR